MNYDNFSENGDGIELLDNFYNECLINRNSHNNTIKRLSVYDTISMICAIFFLALVSLDTKLNSTICSVVGCIGFIISVIAMIKLTIRASKEKQNTYYEQQSAVNINHDYLYEYLKFAHLSRFTDKMPRCLTMQSTIQEEKSRYAKPALIITIPTMTIGLLISYDTLDSAWNKIMSSLAFLLVGCIGLCILYFGVIKRFINSKKYDEIVDAVCIEVNKRRSGDGQSVSQPVYYTKCKNGHKYILFNDTFSNFGIPEIGDIIQLKVNSKNPLQWLVMNAWGNYLFFSIMGIGITVAGITGYILAIM